MKFSRHRVSADVLLDARRALWLEPARALVIADLHLGYPWAQRHRGQLVPLGDAKALAARLESLMQDYAPREVVFLGDIVHRAVPVPALVAEFQSMLHALIQGGCVVSLVAGNHDRGLGRLITRLKLAVALVPAREIAGCRLIHGDQPEPGGTSRITRIIGHEHPAVALGDGVTAMKCPCFLLSPELIILPAFSDWTTGTVVGRYPFMSTLAQNARFTQAVAVMGNKLLPIPLSK